EGKIGYQYRLKSLNSARCSVYSNEATLSVKPLPVLRLTVPEPVCPGEGASFRVSVSGPAGAAAEYKWERKAVLPLPPLNGVPQWSNEEETFPENTDRLQLVDASRNMLDGTRGRTLTREKDNGSEYTVTVTAENGCTASSEGILGVLPFPRADSGPTLSQTTPVCENQEVSIRITNSGSAVQWQESPPGTPEAFIDIANLATDVNTYTFSQAPLAKDGYKYRVKLTGVNRCEGYSESVTLNVNPSPRLEPIPSQSICPGDVVTFEARASG
ncbi:MAG: hypothetical protein CRN43_19785, partial [Candidatus Nephrothrix sp. EaCA]